ncbi:MAG: ATP synthase F1 subunit delta [Acidobacteriota bacterium]
MKKVSLAKKYAKALSESLKDEKEYGKTRSELEYFTEFLNSDLKLKAGLETMLFGFSQKKEILDIYKKKSGIAEKTYNFLVTLIENNRMSYLKGIMEVLEDQWFESIGIEKFVLISAVEINEEQEENLKQQLKKSLKSDVIFEKQVDPSLLAGIKLMKDSIYYDFSIEGNLKKLRESLVGDEMI